MGLTFTQELTGAARRAGEGQERALSLRLVACPRAGPWPLRGELRVQGWIDGAAVSGRLRCEAGAGAGLVYELGFALSGGASFELVAHLRPRWQNPVASLTSLEGRIDAATGREVARVLMRWDLRHRVVPLLLGRRRRDQ